MVETQEKNIGISQVWRFFASMRVGLLLMFLLAGAAALGVLLPQETTNQGDVFSKIKALMGINQIFSAWWFKSLAVLLAFNTLACVINRVRAVTHVFRYPHMRVSAVERLKFNETFTLKGNIQEVSETVSQALLAARYRVLQNIEEDQIFYYADKHRLRVLGSIIAHLGALLLIAGVVWGGFSSYEGQVSAVAGSSFELSQIAVNETAKRVSPPYILNLEQSKIVPTSGGNSEPKSNLSLVKNGTVLATGEVGFNTPFEYGDMSIHLVKLIPGIQVNVSYLGNTTPVILTSSGSNFTRIPGNENLVILWKNISPRVNNPTVDFALAEGSNLVQQGHLSAGTIISPLDQLSISLEGYRGITSLRVVENPGLGLVAGGGGLLVLGMSLSLLLSYRKVWISLLQEGEQVLVSAGGYGSLKLDFGPQFAELVEEIKAYQGG